LPGYTYYVQRATAVFGPWLVIGTITTDPNGLGAFTDTNAPAAHAFYRIAWQPAATMLSPARISNGFQIKFTGLAGYGYSLLRASSVAGPWTTLSSITTDVNGLGTFPDTNAPPTKAFYRTTYP